MLCRLACPKLSIFLHVGQKLNIVFPQDHAFMTALVAWGLIGTALFSTQGAGEMVQKVALKQMQRLELLASYSRTRQISTPEDPSGNQYIPGKSTYSLSCRLILVLSNQP